LDNAGRIVTQDGGKNIIIGGVVQCHVRAAFAAGNGLDRSHLQWCFDCFDSEGFYSLKGDEVNKVCDLGLNALCFGDRPDAIVVFLSLAIAQPEEVS